MDTAVRACRCAHNPSRLKPWTPGSKRPATDSPRLGRFHRRVGLPDAAGAATECLIRLTLGGCRDQRGHRATSRSTV